MKLRIKFLLAFILLALAPLVVVQFFLFTNFSQQLEDQFISSLEVDNARAAFRFRESLSSYSNLVVSLTKLPPISGILRSQNTGFDSKENTSYELWRERLGIIFSSFVEANQDIFNIRFVSLKGLEVVRVDNSQGVLEIVSTSKLQDKSGRDYFQEGLLEENGGVYISNVELNQENNVIEVPHNPVVRFVSPAYVGETLTGVIVINVRELPVLSKLKSNTTVLDQDGFYLYRNGAFTSPENSSENYFQESGGLVDNDIRRLVSKGYFFNSIKNKHVFWERVELDSTSKRSVIILTSEDDSIIQTLVKDFQYTILVISLFVLIIAILISLFLSKRISKPIEQLKNVTQKFAQGDFVNFEDLLENQRTDEIGELTESFNTMKIKLQDMYTGLESKVSERTQKLELQNKDLEKNREAMINLLEDVEEDKKRTEELKTRLEIATQAGRLGVFEWNSKTDILEANDITYDILVIPNSLGVGVFSKTLEMVHKEDKERFSQTVQKALSDKKGFNDIFRLTYADGKGEKYVKIVAEVKKDVEDLTLIGVLLDVTKEKEVDRAKTEFVSLASHQLRTPLSAINWYAEMLLSGDAGEVNKEQKQYLEEVYRGNQRMVSLVNALLNVSRLDLGTFSVEPEEADIIEIAQIVVKELSQAAEKKKQTVETQFDESLITVVDKNLINILIQNLLSNAIKYTQEGGKIVVTLAKKKAGEEIAGKNLEKDSVVYCVSDNGLGIPKSQQEKIFTKLFRADNVRQTDAEGTGLGLYIIKSIVETIGGNIWFTSEENKGTTFCITFAAEGMKKKDGSRKLEI